MFSPTVCQSHNQKLRTYRPTWSRDVTSSDSSLRPRLTYNGNHHQVSKKLKFSNTIKKGASGFVSRPFCSEVNNIFINVDPGFTPPSNPEPPTPPEAPPLFSYTFNNTSTSYTLSDEDKQNYENAMNRWSSIITSNPMNESINVTFEIADLPTNVLGQAYISDIYIVPGTTGNKLKELYPKSGVITLNHLYFESMKANIRNDGNNDLFNVITHELGHILGIGTLFGLSDAYFGYLVDNQPEYMYVGANALREYKACFPPYFSNVTYLGIPIEEDGGAGTALYHPEEGNLVNGYVSSNNRTYLGVHYPGMQNELMTGWTDSGSTNLPISRISIGFLQDIGYGVDYSKADVYPL